MTIFPIARRKERQATVPELPGVLDRRLTAKQKTLAEGNQALIGWCYKKCARRCICLTPPEEEILWECMERRFIRACQEFRPELGYRFSTFAAKCMLWSGYADFLRICRRRLRLISLDQELGGEGANGAHDTTVGVFAEGVRDTYEEEMDFAYRVEWMVGIVGQRRADWIVLKHVHGVSFAQIGRDEGLSKERVRQIVSEALATLRRAMGEVAS